MSINPCCTAYPYCIHEQHRKSVYGPDYCSNCNALEKQCASLEADRNMLKTYAEKLEKENAQLRKALEDIRNRETIGQNMLTSTGVVAQEALKFACEAGEGN